MSPVRLTPDGRYVILTDSSNNLRILDIKTGLHRVLAGHSDEVNSMIISPDGQFVVSSSCDFTIRFWRIISGECCNIFFIKGLTQISFDWKGDGLVAALSEGSVLKFQIENMRMEPLITTGFLEGRIDNSDKVPLTARPVCCSQLVDVPAAVTERIDHWSTHPGEDGYTDPALLMPCPQCQTPLRMNPFFVAPPPL
jgi:WD40 repeat protein